VGRLTLDSPDVTLSGGVTAREVEVRQGTWQLNSGRVSDARITAGPGGRIIGNATLSNVTLAADLTVNSKSLVVAGSLTLDDATMWMGDTALRGGDLRGQGRIVFDGTALGSVDVPNVIESGIEVVVGSGKPLTMGARYARTNFVNQGKITVDAGGVRWGSTAAAAGRTRGRSRWARARRCTRTGSRPWAAWAR
jgi:hypothetical protein